MSSKETETIKKAADKGVDLREIERILENRQESYCELIEVLQDVQTTFNYLPEDALKLIAEKLELPVIEVFRVANFYKAFTLKPRGKYLLTVCTGTACHVRGAPKFLDELLGQLGIEPGQTTQNGQFTVETVNCLGACALGPIVVLDGTYYDHMTAGKLRLLIENIREKSNKNQSDV
ncbi:MAG: NAD(P)H-dependent oxidoreductase subunit E [Candidatus Omnitrophota bacterium]